MVRDKLPAHGDPTSLYTLQLLRSARMSTLSIPTAAAYTMAARRALSDPKNQTEAVSNYQTAASPTNATVREAGRDCRSPRSSGPYKRKIGDAPVAAERIGLERTDGHLKALLDLTEPHGDAALTVMATGAGQASMPSGTEPWSRNLSHDLRADSLGLRTYRQASQRLSKKDEKLRKLFAELGPPSRLIVGAAKRREKPQA